MGKLFLLIVIAFLLFRHQFFKPSLQKSSRPKQTATKTNETLISIVATNLEIPWAIAFLPDKRMLVTERPGRIRMIDEKGKLQPDPLMTISDVKHVGEGGLLGIAIHPNFSEKPYVYVYYTYSEQNGNTLNKIVRYSFRNGKFSDEKVIIDGIPGAINHNGGRLRFGPDKFLYATTGDAQEPSLAQDKNSLAGKILCMTDEGKPAPRNLFKNYAYSYGHRNSQGITWDKTGQLWATEHGRSGLQSGLDELNKIAPGKNYGWPTIQGDETKAGMETPFLNSGANDTWAPGGITYVDNTLYFVGLKGQALYKVDAKTKTVTAHFKHEFGRLRDVVIGPDGMLYVTTSNLDGRGNPMKGDDKILKINPQQ